MNILSGKSPQGSAMSKVTPTLFFSCFCLVVGDMLFGYDTASFGGLLANPVFTHTFGQYNAVKRAYAISSLRTSLLSSLAFIGKLVGCLGAGPYIEKFGHRWTLTSACAISFVGVIIEMTSFNSTPGSGKVAQFIVGRILVYITVGMVEVAVPTYQSELVPAPLRGFVVLSLQLFLALGGLIATIVNKVYSTDGTLKALYVVLSLQFVWPVVILATMPFIPDSPRWLLSKNRDQDAIASMRRLRPASDVAEGRCEEEIAAIREALEQHTEKLPWLDMVKGTNLRRTGLVMVFYTFQQITGQAFVSTYQTVFYRNYGFADKAFTYPVISSALILVTVLIGMLLIDNFGRRNLLMASFFLQALFIMLVAGIGSQITPRSSTTTKNSVVAFFMLYALMYNFGGANVPYLLGTELPTAGLREKTMAFGAGLNVFWAWLTNFVIPYMLAALKFKVGYIFGGISVLALVFTFFFLPETKGRALEEIDAIFSVPFNPIKPKAIPVTPAEQYISALESAPAGAVESKHLDKGTTEQMEALKE